MDKSFHNAGVSRSPFSSGPRSRLGSGSSLATMTSRKSLQPGSSAGLSMAASALKKAASGRYSVSGRSTQSLLGIRSECNVVESYGFQLPVLVNEALTFNEKIYSVSVMCSQNGWAWVVHGRRLLIWQYKDVRSTAANSNGSSSPRSARSNVRRAGGLAQCRELTLPQCDIGHKASLVCVFLGDTQQMASCLAVSPTGDVRYWPSIAHDGSSVNITGILDGQEFDYLLEIPQQNGYLLVTTTCNLVFLQLQFNNGRHVVQHKTIKQPSGFLGGIGKKFGSYLFGMNSGNEKENKFVSIALEKSEEGDAIVTLLADRWIQCWSISNNGSNETLLYEDTNIVRRIRDEFLHKFWNIRVAAETVDIQLHLLDMCLFENKFYILAGAVNTMHTPQIYYGIVVLSDCGDGMQFENLISLKLTQYFSTNTEHDCLSLRFIMSRTHVYMYTDKVIYPVSLSNPSMVDIEADKIEFHLQDDRLLYAALVSQIPVFFSRTHGLVSITPSDFDNSDSLNNSCNIPDLYSPIVGESTLRAENLLSDGSVNEQNLYMYDLDPDTLYHEFKDEVSQLKAAFVYRLKRNNTMCNTILSDLLPSTAKAEGQTSAITESGQLDKIVVTIAEELAEDIPAADPRWGENASKTALGSSSSMQIITQLKEKNLALRHYIDFLHSTGIWDKLTAISSAGGAILKPTSFIISDINEKIIAAIALRSMKAKYGKLIDEAINHVMNQWNEKPHGNLTAHDLFYVRICKFQEIFQAFCDITDKRIESQHQSASLAATIGDINTIVLNLLNEIVSFREQHSAIFSLSADKLETYEFMPWTAMSGNVGLRDALSHLVDVTVRYGARCTAGDVELKQKLYQQILELIDFILDGKKNYLDSVRDTEKYNVLQQQFESQRRDMISIFIEDQLYEFAAKLAEKYLDFQSLIVICDETDNQERLNLYIKRFEEYDFSQFAINWHLRQNRQGEVFERFKGNQAALSQFMRDHPTLGWIQLVFNGDFERAAKILIQLTESETEYVQRKKSMLSLAKLSAFAATDTDLSLHVENINSELSIIDYQEQLNLPLLETFGYDVENQKVLKCDEIINLFISEENDSANEFEFRKALELLNYMEEPFEARHKIWCAAILRDNWTEYDTNQAVDYLQNLLFFRLVEVCHLMDPDLESELPPIEDFLNSTDLGDLVHNKSFQYLFKLTYEYINDAFKKSDDFMDTNSEIPQ